MKVTKLLLNNNNNHIVSNYALNIGRVTMNVHVRQHYIPQFIIKNFCKTDNKTYYFDVSNKSIAQKFPNEIFEENYLYEYSQDKKENLNKIELDLAKFETEVGNVIKQFLTNYSVSVSFEESEMLKYFFFIMILRSKFMLSSHNKEILEFNQQSFPDITEKELDEFYKKNLEKLVNCRTLMDINETINTQFIQYAAMMLVNKHLVLFECGDKLEFVLGDAYPIALGQKIHPINIMSLVSLIFPISYNRAIGLVDTYDEFHSMLRRSKISNKDWYDEPKRFGVDRYLIQLKYLNDEDVAYINKGILNNSREGVCFRSERKCGLEFA